MLDFATNMTRHTAFSFALLGFLSFAAGCGAEEPVRPNIVVIVSDDQGWGDVGYNGSEIRTPHIDQLASDGVKFDRFYSHPACSLTRSALMTGRSNLKTGVILPFNPWYEMGLPLDEKLLPEYFREEGYQTIAVGKWHLGPNKDDYHPNRRGFDRFYGFLGGFINHYLHTFWGGVDWQRDGETVMEEGYSTQLITQEAVRMIRERDRKKPIFLYVAYAAPHSPLQAPPETVATYASIADENRRIYAAMVTEMDQGIGEIRAALEEEGLSEDTLVWFLSDNGGAERLGADNGPLRGGKATLWEGGIRVPSLVSWPSTLPAGSTFADPVVVEDMLPTLLGAAGIDVDSPMPLDGRDAWSALTGEAPLRPKPLILAGRGRGLSDYSFAYLKDEWKVVQQYDREQGEFYQQLFRILDDPYETQDLAAQHPDVVEGIVAEFQALPKGPMHGLDAAPLPAVTEPGGPGSALPDNSPPSRPPYAESEWQPTP